MNQVRYLEIVGETVPYTYDTVDALARHLRDFVMSEGTVFSHQDRRGDHDFIAAQGSLAIWSY